MASFERIDALLRAAAENGEVPGAVACAATADRVVYEGAFGRRDIAAPGAMCVDTVFRIASMTKAVTGAAAMQLVEQGKLALDEPIGRVLPQLAEPRVLDGFDAAGQPRLRPVRRPITLKHLLTHTAGFSYDIWNADTDRLARALEIPPARSGRRRALDMPLIFDPGERWEYGINIDWVGQAVEAAGGLDLQAYLQEHVTGPLAMKDTGFLLGSRVDRLARVHRRAADGSLQPLDMPPPVQPEFYPGGGGLLSTAGDYLRFLRMLLNGGELDGARLLRPETVALMGQNHIGELAAGVMRTAQPETSNDVDFFPGQKLKWGLTFLINTEPVEGGRSDHSLTWGGLFNTYYWLDPQRNVAGVIATQILPFADTRVVPLARAFERGVYAALA